MIPSPLPRALKYVGPPRSGQAAPFGLVYADDGDALAVSLTTSSDVESIARELPPPSELSSGTLVVLLPNVAPKGLRALFAPARPASRALRSGALLARGYVDLGACVDTHTKQDLVWGRAP